MHKFTDIVTRMTLMVSIGLFVVCLLGNGYCIEELKAQAWSPAWSLLLFGWIGVFYGSTAWLANPALLVAWVLSLCRRPTLSLLAALMAVVLMATFLLQKIVVSSEAPTYSRIAGYGIGYWLWLASALTQMAGSAVATFSTKYLAPTKPVVD
jgi:hypothetical protein